MNKKQFVLLILQLGAVIAASFISGDTLYASANGIIGVIFNFLVSLNFPAGFIFGFVYALTNGILAFQTRVYATFAFMIFLQAPMAVYSYVKWKKSQKQYRQPDENYDSKAARYALLSYGNTWSGYVFCFEYTWQQFCNF